MTLPQIEAFLAENQLRFLGFDIDFHTRWRYLARFPDDGSLTNLHQWNVFETENPQTFAGMYQFWIQKPQ